MNEPTMVMLDMLLRVILMTSVTAVVQAVIFVVAALIFHKLKD